MNWENIVGRLGPRLYNYFIRRGFLRDAADLTQEVFSRLHQKLSEGSYDESRGSIDAFTFGIARFVALENNHLNQIVLTTSEEFDWDALLVSVATTSMEDDYHRHQTIELFLKEITSLSAIQQDVLTLYMDDEMTLDDMALVLKLPVGTVKSHLHRAKEKLKDLLSTKGICL
ncbi:MAG: RNA polymerase sigma factor [Bdellovibrionaceae bacterium]|nr:RNA polymerase sigma factor [Pseudobdellovibrionaceae bacterium]